MQVLIKVAGRYNGIDNKAVDCKAGYVLNTGEGYGLSLIDSGYAVRFMDLSTQVDSVEADNSDADNSDADKSGVDKSGVDEAAKVAPVKAYDFTQIKGISTEINEALHVKGITTLDGFKEVIEAGQVLDIPGLTLRKLAAIKKQLEM